MSDVADGLFHRWPQQSPLPDVLLHVPLALPISKHSTSLTPWIWASPKTALTAEKTLCHGWKTCISCLLMRMPSCRNREAIWQDPQVSALWVKPSCTQLQSLWWHWPQTPCNCHTWQTHDRPEESHTAKPRPPEGLWEGVTKYCLRPRRYETMWCTATDHGNKWIYHFNVFSWEEWMD